MEKNKKINYEQCCTVSCEKPLDQDYWDTQYKESATGWDLGQVAPVLVKYINSIDNKSTKILIPGCGNTYEADYLLQQGFLNITVIDIAPSLVKNLRKKFADNKNITIIQGDFFEHEGNYDLILEQTFFCALPPIMRQRYVWKMHELLNENGKLAGLLFNRTFEIGPPFGGSKEAYENLFKPAFIALQMDENPDSAAPRAKSEVFIELKKNKQVVVALYQFEGITCSGCMNTVKAKFESLNTVLHASMSTNFEEILLVSRVQVSLTELQNSISYDDKYKIKRISK